MYITKIEIENIRSLEKVVWEIEAKTPEDAKGWHVILGDNGAGKSTFLRSVALALVGPTEAAALREVWSSWLRDRSRHAECEIRLDGESGWDNFSKAAGGVQNSLAAIIGMNVGEVDGKEFSFLTDILPLGPSAGDYIWGRSAGWFSASYGPFRRFSGGDTERAKIYKSNRLLARHLTLFGEDAALTEVIEWLKDLRFKELEKEPEGELVDIIREFIIKSQLLPHGVRLGAISSHGVQFLDANESEVDIDKLSDGYRSILSMTFELIRQLVLVYGQKRVFESDCSKIIAPGVVLIDEIDVHLHPSWQRDVGHWFTKHFPNIQFIVTTHSPLVCQAAGSGSIFRLPTPGTEETGGMVTGTEFDRLVNGNIMEAYNTPAFGVSLTRSDDSQRLLQRLAELNVKEFDGPLSAVEKSEQLELRAAMPSSAFVLPAGVGDAR